MVFDYGRLIDRIAEMFSGQTVKLCEAVGMAERDMEAKLNSQRPFTQPEIFQICRTLNIPANQIGRYFFQNRVQE